MQISYETEIINTLYDVYELGFAKVEWRKIYRWYGATRLTNRVWDDLDNRFQEIDESETGKGYRLGFYDCEDSAIQLTLICLDPKGTSEKESSFQPISMKKKE
tara:strand:+ start:21174 stop:21482 length:309 start_codon:yes stop_codon:yes gene_type:complete